MPQCNQTCKIKHNEEKLKKINTEAKSNRYNSVLLNPYLMRKFKHNNWRNLTPSM